MTITVETTIAATAQKVWACFTQPEHIMKWNFAIDTWHCPQANNTLIPGGAFSYTMAAKDGSFSFDLTGTFDEVKPNSELNYTLSDGRKVQVHFAETNGQTLVTQTFEPESMNSHELQQQGWQAILNNFKGYVERA